MKIFMVMPFKPEFFNLFEYGYAHVCRELGLEIETVRDDLQPGPIPNKILKKIEESDLVLVDASEVNGNVFFEAGFAAGLGKTVIYAVDDVEKIPFDTKQDLHMIHQGEIGIIRRDLPGYLASAIEHTCGTNLLANPFLKVNQDGWLIRSSKREARKCGLDATRIDRERTLGRGSSLSIRRVPQDGTPLERAVSVVEFTSYQLPDGNPTEFLPIERLGKETASIRCHVFIQSEERPLQHRWRMMLYRKPPEYLSHVWGSFSHITNGGGWGLLEDRLQLPSGTDARFFRLAIESIGGDTPTTYRISRPFVTLSR